ncbi:MAG TPA: NAD(P)H-dependent oxidoreductase subunit E [Solirubrobacterales bacterium]|nr:NAD(P)H-dependent oxidoreductase subunit E [Solirubrobacterales bacterium]
MAELPVDPAVREGRIPARAEEEIPELHEVGCPPELRERIETLMGRYPDRRSASIPALWAVQERYGWCTPDGIRQAAAVMRVTPAYLESVASFYDLLHTSPVGRHRIEVCTNISCWMRGGDRLLEAFEAAAAGDEDFFVTGFECLGACDIAPMASIDQRYYGPLEAAEAATAIEQLRAEAEVLPDKALAKRPLAGDTPSTGRTVEPNPPMGRNVQAGGTDRPVGREDRTDRPVEGESGG